ncbi:hypothetical protein GCM10022237_28800 [Nocardioides ginsengisoli]|uniref:Protein NO VEIN C-terminal domain-containing protein n=1 Tax=Nocardioides ginsengisoli TaxID=363868 RepID=A0ABW3W2V5_9ACTN
MTQRPSGVDASRLVAVHIGQHPPGSEAESVQLRIWENARESRSGSTDDHLRVPADVDWERHGLTPRWIGQETADCVAAIDPGHYAGRGDTERKRFLAGAKSRGEVAVVIAGIGHAVANNPYSWNIFGPPGGRVWVTGYTTISGRRLPAGTRPQLADDLSPADRDLALRIVNQSSDNSAWWSLNLEGATTVRGDGWGGETRHQAEGRLVPILVDGLGDPIVAAWMSDTEDECWYIIPDGTDWDTVLGWLIAHGLPELVPSALRRVRSSHFEDPALQTRSERDASQALTKLEEEYDRERSAIHERLDAARVRAERVRDGLLFGTGAQVVVAVRTVLEDCGLSVIDLDAQFDGKSADLLATGPGGRRRLIEVKATAGMPGEDKARDLIRHLSTWPELCPNEPVDGGVLIVNHQHRLPPPERSPKVFTRPEFVATLTFPVLPSWRLFRWWAEEDHASIVDALFPEGQAKLGPRLPGPSPKTERRWWSRSRSS